MYTRLALELERLERLRVGSQQGLRVKAVKGFRFLFDAPGTAQAAVAT